MQFIIILMLLGFVLRILLGFLLNYKWKSNFNNMYGFEISIFKNISALYKNSGCDIGVKFSNTKFSLTIKLLWLIICIIIKYLVKLSIIDFLCTCIIIFFMLGETLSYYRTKELLKTFTPENDINIKTIKCIKTSSIILFIYQFILLVLIQLVE